MTSNLPAHRTHPRARPQSLTEALQWLFGMDRFDRDTSSERPDLEDTTISIDRDVTQRGRGLIVTHHLTSHSRTPVTVTDPVASSWNINSAKFHPDQSPR